MYKNVLFLCLIMCTTIAQATPKKIVSITPYQLSIISISLPPLQYYNEQHQLEGYFVDVIKAALATTEIPHTMHLYPWARSYRLAQQQANVCIFSLNRIPEREPLFKWVAQLAETYSALYSLKSRTLKIRSLDEAKEKYIGAAIRNGVYHQLLIRNGFEENKNVYVVSDTDALVKLFYSGTKIDFILADDIVLDRLVKKLNFDSDAFQRQFYLDLAPLKDYIACSPLTHDKSVERLKAAFITIKDNGDLAKINNKWRSRFGLALIDNLAVTETVKKAN